MRKSARTQIPPFFDNDPYKGSVLICFLKKVFTFICRTSKLFGKSCKNWVGRVGNGRYLVFESRLEVLHENFSWYNVFL